MNVVIGTVTTTNNIIKTKTLKPYGCGGMERFRIDRKKNCSLVMLELYTRGKSGLGKNQECRKEAGNKAFPYGCPEAFLGEKVQKKHVVEPEPAEEPETGSDHSAA